MKKIWKYAINPKTKLEMPAGSRILTLHTQDNQPQLWALVDPTAPLVTRVFHALPTGVKFDDGNLSYIGTVHINSGTLVFHIFEERL